MRIKIFYWLGRFFPRFRSWYYKNCGIKSEWSLLDMRNPDGIQISESIKGLWGVRNYIQEGGIL